MRLVLAVLLLAGVAPLAGAASFALHSGEPVALRADVVADLPGGVALASEPEAWGDAEWTGATGRLTIRTWDLVAVAAPGARVKQDLEERTSSYDLDGATLALRVAGERYRLDLVAGPDATVRVVGRIDAEGRPLVLARDVPRDTSSPQPAVVPETAPPLSWVWKAGWTFVGGIEHFGRHDGFPRPARATLAFEGPLEFHLTGGNLTFTDASGAARTVALGRTAGTGAAPAGPAQPQRETWVRAEFAGVVSSAAVPVERAWGVAAPSAAWRVDGAAVFPRATGTVEDDGRAVAVEDATVEVEGAFDVRPAAVAAVTPVTVPRYEGRGDARFRVDGAAVAAGAPPAGAREAAAGAVLLALLAAGLRGGLLLYTRIDPRRVLENPLRRAMHATVVARPGIHARDLQRAAGVAWGAFAFHLRVLVDARWLRLERSGKYLCVFPAAAAPDPRDLVVGPLARRLLDNLPSDGRPRIVAEIAAELGVSRQLVAHHARTLARRGLVRMGEDGARRTVARSETDAPANRS